MSYDPYNDVIEKARIKMRKRLKKIPLSEFTADYTLDICIVTNPAIFADCAEMSVGPSLERLEKFFEERDRKRK